MAVTPPLQWLVGVGHLMVFMKGSRSSNAQFCVNVVGLAGFSITPLLRWKSCRNRWNKVVLATLIDRSNRGIMFIFSETIFNFVLNSKIFTL
jgi:hypothetical protein